MELEVIRNRVYTDCRVRVDGKRFVACEFIRAVLVTDGYAPTVFDGCSAAQGPDACHVELVLGLLRTRKRYHDVVLPDPSSSDGLDNSRRFLRKTESFWGLCRRNDVSVHQLVAAAVPLLATFMRTLDPGELESLDASNLNRVTEGFTRLLVNVPARAAHAHKIAAALRPTGHTTSGETIR